MSQEPGRDKDQSDAMRVSGVIITKTWGLGLCQGADGRGEMKLGPCETYVVCMYDT